jgi:hypothetical protein
MKIGINGILSTAINMKNQGNSAEDSQKGEKTKSKTDSVEIRSRLASRLGIIQDELKTLQSSLTKNQIIKEGIGQLKDDYESGNSKKDFIINQNKFENTYVLNDFLGEGFNYDKIINSGEKIDKLIEKDINDLKALQIEIENIAASSLVNGEIIDKVAQIEHSISNIDYSSVSNISNLKPETVIGLVR